MNFNWHPSDALVQLYSEFIPFFLYAVLYYVYFVECIEFSCFSSIFLESTFFLLMGYVVKLLCSIANIMYYFEVWIMLLDITWIFFFLQLFKLGKHSMIFFLYYQNIVYLRSVISNMKYKMKRIILVINHSLRNHTCN